jgi:hypothetical protein
MTISIARKSDHEGPRKVIKSVKIGNVALSFPIEFILFKKLVANLYDILVVGRARASANFC